MSGIRFFFCCLSMHSCLCVSSPEIFLYREANENKTTVDPPEIDDPAFRALVEENVKDSVFNIVISPVMQQHWTAYIAQEQAQNGTSSSVRRRADTGAALKPVYVHGELVDCFFLSFPSRVFVSPPRPAPPSRSTVPRRDLLMLFPRVRLRHRDWRRYRPRNFLRPARAYFPGSPAGSHQAGRRPTGPWPCPLVNPRTGCILKRKSALLTILGAKRRRP